MLLSMYNWMYLLVWDGSNDGFHEMIALQHRINCGSETIFFIFLFFLSVAVGIATVNHYLSSNPVLCILYTHTNLQYTLLH